MIKLHPTDKIWITADLHLGHKNICRGVSVWKDSSTTRDFDSIYQMDVAIINNINRTVGETDHLFIVGDLLFGEKIYSTFFDHLICKNIYIIYGNHDNLDKLKSCLHPSIKFQGDYLKLLVGRQEIILFHYPVFSWENISRGSWMIYGHCHNTLINEEYNKLKCFDVGIDWEEFRPYSFDDIKNIMEKRKIFHIDHHTIGHG